MGRARCAVAAVAAVVAILPSAAGAAATSYRADGTIVLNGNRFFPIALAKGPLPGWTTPAGADALTAVTRAGVNFLKVGPASRTWTSGSIADAIYWNEQAAARGLHTWINLSTLSTAAPGSWRDVLLQRVVKALLRGGGRSAIGMWKGADEPSILGIQASALEFAYCRATSRGDRSWCRGEPPLDSAHLWVTIHAPVGSPTDLAPYTAVTDVQGVDAYPVTFADPAPNLHQVGLWTGAVAQVSPGRPVWATLQICSWTSRDRTTGAFVLPTWQQERYMVYDAIVNGARALAFYGGNNPACWSPSDRAHGWNWTFWNGVLKQLVEEISAASPLAPVLLHGDANVAVATSDATTQAIRRPGATPDDLWLIAARSGAGTASVTLSGLPSWTAAGRVYVEKRSVTASGGAITDTFDQWGVHVYHFVEPPSIAAVAPARAAAGAAVTITGSGLASATGVSFNGARARFHATSDAELTATVPAAATSGPIRVRSPGGIASPTNPFGVLPGLVVRPRLAGRAQEGRVLRASRGRWSGSPAAYAYRWERCDARGASCVMLRAPTGRAYTPTHALVGRTLRVTVTATNAAGSATATSPRSARVLAANR